MKKALNFANEYINILKYDMDVIYHARKSLLFDSSHTWIKNQRGLLDVTRGSFDGAEVCALVGTYLLNVLCKKYKKNDFGLYCDNRLFIFKDMD